MRFIYHVVTPAVSRGLEPKDYKTVTVTVDGLNLDAGDKFDLHHLIADAMRKMVGKSMIFTEADFSDFRVGGMR